MRPKKGVPESFLKLPLELGRGFWQSQAYPAPYCDPTFSLLLKPGPALQHLPSHHPQSRSRTRARAF